MTSFYAGFVIFSIIGVMAHESDLPVSKVISSGESIQAHNIVTYFIFFYRFQILLSSVCIAPDANAGYRPVATGGAWRGALPP